ncbi:MAG: hypothetical protein PUC39_10415 [Lachnospiraceae bacterium]|nr:hypothetical protein [Lachnospiraceae bacterium]
MELRTCRLCGFSFYSRKDTNLCDDCQDKADALYTRIVAYLKEYPNSNALQISKALDIPAYDVLTFLENGQLLKSHGTFEQLPQDTRLTAIAARKKE